jgi:lactose/L-arabinose transport system permease protein
VVGSLVMSLVRWEGLTPVGFGGFSNYTRLFADPALGRAIVNTAVLWLQVPLLITGALFLASIVNSRIVKGKAFWRAAYFSPVILSLVVAGLAFNLLLDPRFGLVNAVLERVGIHGVNWMGDPNLTKPSLIVLTLWRWSGYYMIILLGGIQAISPELYDAAAVDGCNAWRRFRYITLPLMAPILAFAAVFATAGSLGNFEQIYAMYGSDGGIGESGLSTGLLIWREAFRFSAFGVGSALTFIVSALVLSMAAAQLMIFRQRD